MNRPPEPARPSEPRQRWRVTFARDPVPPEAVGRAAQDGWQAGLVASRLPVVAQGEGDDRLRIAFAAPLPATARGEREWADIWLRDRIAAWELRTALAPHLPDAHAWVDAEDVWLGAPALAGQVVAADWRIELEPSGAATTETLTSAAASLAAARTIPRMRLKAGAEKPYDLRPLLADVRIEAGAATIAVLARTRFHPELGAGRPEEVVAALADAAATPLVTLATTRIRLLLGSDVAPRRKR